MKEILTLLMFMSIATVSTSQVVFSADFEDGTLEGMTIVDNDGLTASSGVSPFMDAWTVSNVYIEAAFDIESRGVISNSRYMPAGTADDWLISPQLTIVDTGTAVLWNARALSEQSPDGMEVRVSTTDSDLQSFTDVIYSSAAESHERTQRSASLNDYIGQQVYVAFINNSTDKYLLVIDDIVVAPIDPINASISSVTTAPYQLKNQDIGIAVNVLNKGGFDLQTLDLKWTDGVAEHEETITGFTLKTGESMIFTSSTFFVASENIVYPIEISISNPNDEQDMDMSDNSVTAEISGISYIPNRKVVGEEGTGTWCGWCPRGTVALDSMEAFFKDEFIGIAVHNADPMTVAEYDSRLGFQGFPDGKIDRRLNMGPAKFKAGLDIAKHDVSPMAIDLVATGNESERTLSVEVTAESVTQLIDRDYRLSVIITEDNVKGTGAGYNQANNYSGLEMGLLVGVDGVDWTTLPNPILAADIEYDHVARAILGGFDGRVGSVPANFSSGDVATEIFSWTVPSDIDMSELHAVALLIDHTTGAILNAEKSEIDVLTSTIEEIDMAEINIYPNPATDVVVLDISLKSESKVNLQIVNGIGKIVSQEDYGKISGSFTSNYDISSLSEGVYMFKICIDNNWSTKKIIVLK